MTSQDIVERLRKLLPVSWTYEVDQTTGEPIYANMQFGEHQTQAMSMMPDDWMALNDLPDHIEALTKRVGELEGALKQARSWFNEEDFAALGPNEANVLKRLLRIIDAALNTVREEEK